MPSDPFALDRGDQVAVRHEVEQDERAVAKIARNDYPRPSSTSPAICSVTIVPDPGQNHGSRMSVLPGRAEHAFGRERALVESVAPSLKPYPAPIVKGVRKARAVAGGVNVRIRRAQPPVDGNAVVERQPRSGGNGDVGGGADAGDDAIGLDGAPVGQRNDRATLRRRGSIRCDRSACCKPDARVLMPLRERFGDRSGHAAHQDSRRGFDDGGVAA